MSDKRMSTRISVSANVAISSEDQAYSFFGRTHDISMNGLYVKSKSEFQLGAKCRIEIAILGKSSQLSIKVRGTVMRRDTEGYGVLFDDDLEFWPLLVILGTTKLGHVQEEFA